MSSNRRFSALALMASWVFLAIPFLLLLIDWSSSRQREMTRLNDESDQKARTLLEKMQVSGNWEYLAIQYLSNFQRGLREELSEIDSKKFVARITARYEERLAHLLPPHNLMVAVKENKNEPLKVVYRKLSPVIPHDLGYVAPLMDNESQTSGQFAEASQKLTLFTGFPVDASQLFSVQTSLLAKDEGIMLPFTSESRSASIYWFYPRVGKRRVLVAALFDASRIAADYPYQAMQGLVDGSVSGFALLPISGKGHAFWSPFLRKQQRLQRFLEREAAYLPMTAAQRQFDGFSIYSTPVLVGESAFLILVRRHTSAIALSAGETLFLAALFIVFGALSLILLQRYIFRRGWRISIALVMLTAIISIFYLPAGLGRLVIKHTLDEHLSAMRKQEEKELERNLQRLEDNYDMAMADFFYRIQHLEEHAPFMQQIAANDDRKALSIMEKEWWAKYPSILANSLLFISLYRENGNNSIKLHGSDNTRNLDEMFAPLLRSSLYKYRPELARKAGSGANLSLNDVKEEMITDFLVKFFQGILGQELYYRMMANPKGLVEANSTFIMISTTGVQLTFDGAIRAVLLAIWSEFNEAECYLNHMIAHRGERADNFEFIAARKSSFQQYQRNTTPIIPEAWNLIERTRRVGIQLTSHELLTSEDRLLIKSRPGKALGLYILAGISSLKSVFAEQARLEEGFNRLLLLGLVLLLLLVGGLYRYFMRPLQRLQTGLDSIRQGDFQARILAGQLDDDEFGSISRSFNAMAKGLQEGSLLGRFVSSAVIKVVKDKAAFERAMKGEKRTMTILFASLKAISESEADTLIEQLAFHLKACQETVRPTAGVIDKVMENKILVFFDHEACNGADHAVRQAVETIFALKHKLAAGKCKGYYGIATGQVVAGILGARNLRLDYTVIGDAVNLAARLNALAADDTGTQIIADDRTRSLLPAFAASENLGNIKIKGKTAPVAIHRLNMRT